MGNPDRIAKRPRQYPDADEAERPQALQHLRDQRAPQDAVLQGVAVDQERRSKRAEAVYADRVPSAAANDAEIRLPRADIADQPVLVPHLAEPPAGLDVDLDRTVRETRDGVGVSELAGTFAVSEVTVRHDLSELARQGLVARVRGGVRALGQGQSEVGFDLRLRLEVERKRAIARGAAGARTAIARPIVFTADSSVKFFASGYAFGRNA